VTDEAIILSTWNWVTDNSGWRPGEEALQKIIAEITQEMSEQMCIQDAPPLVTVRSMMAAGWVWGCMCLVFEANVAVKAQLSEYLSALQSAIQKFEL
jgi:hypothetical protein